MSFMNPPGFNGVYPQHYDGGMQELARAGGQRLLEDMFGHSVSRVDFQWLLDGGSSSVGRSSSRVHGVRDENRAMQQALRASRSFSESYLLSQRREEEEMNEAVALSLSEQHNVRAGWPIAGEDGLPPPSYDFVTREDRYDGGQLPDPDEPPQYEAALKILHGPVVGQKRKRGED